VAKRRRSTPRDFNGPTGNKNRNKSNYIDRGPGWDRAESCGHEIGPISYLGYSDFPPPSYSLVCIDSWENPGAGASESN